jgi:hypothetical protein
VIYPLAQPGKKSSLLLLELLIVCMYYLPFFLLNFNPFLSLHLASGWQLLVANSSWTAVSSQQQSIQYIIYTTTQCLWMAIGSPVVLSCCCCHPKPLAYVMSSRETRNSPPSTPYVIIFISLGFLFYLSFVHSVRHAKPCYLFSVFWFFLEAKNQFGNLMLQ